MKGQIDLLNNIERLQEKLTDSVCGALIFSEKNRFYFSGLDAEDGIIVVSKTKSVLLIDSRYIETARKQVKNCEVVLLQDTEVQLPQVVFSLGIKVLGIESYDLPVAKAISFAKLLHGIKVDMSDSLSKAILSLRMIKTEAEINNIQKAQDITDAAFKHICEWVKPGMSELEIKLECEYFMKGHGATAPSFDLITVTGENCSLPHGVPGPRKLQNGEFLLMDIGAIYNGYCSDMTRTVAIGEVSEEQKKAYSVCLEAQLAAEKAIKPGVICSDIDKIARDIIGASEFPVFGHGLGHSVGIEIHEEPRFSPKCNTKVREGMVITVEPGIYVEGQFGIRIEDTVLVTESGIRVFANSPKELITL